MDNSADKYTIVIVYDNQKGRENSFQQLDEFFLQLHQSGKGDSGAIHISLFKYDEKSIKSFIACIPKEMNDYLNTEEGKKLQEDKEWGVRRYTPFMSKKENEKKFNKSNGFYVDRYIETFIESMEKLTGKYITQDSYEIIRPPPDENGNDRNYILVNFKENKNGYIPRKFMQKLKILLDNTPIENDNILEGSKLKVRWAKNGVLKDSIKGANKKIKVKN